ncbi:head-tail joining protein [Burkholderia multivorans]|uniref:Uncharacterized protein n=1 Tax=Burkholderia multivorans TaxID=87883 RepID=A0AAP2HPP0_9BURK|nr:hypothetical protein [Burkholderia multivorans]MBU9359560.1 hypothetical protein [Burkholderia multivorans]MCA8260815.1 hypothetical protein [Burkholderia multivorans]MCO8609727.1 hypothetical protein [Burkholderia multivorans]MCO8638352.1 hypothetical protein [Burkholderia multivorans]MCO8644576.1 hypothetical protein [Burkholderia multivorans]
MEWDDVVDAKILSPLQRRFGTKILYQPATGVSFDITGIYDKAFFGVDPTTGESVVTNQPTVGLQLSQFAGHAAPLQGDQLTILRTGEVWTVREVHPDGHGAARLMLNVPGQTDV